MAHKHNLACLEADAHGKLMCKITGQGPPQFEVYDPLTNLEASAAHFGRKMTGRYYTSRKAAQADADDMTSYHKRSFRVRSV